jgi:hypothetical protein
MGLQLVSEKPLAGKNRILDFAQFQNYKYISFPKTLFSGFLQEEWREISANNSDRYPELAD